VLAPYLRGQTVIPPGPEPTPGGSPAYGRGTSNR